jgi:Cofactor assembly of complex C subunit B, CCB2/CCB4
MAKSDQNQVIRQLPIVAGVVSGILLFANRMVTTDLTETQSRSDAVGVIISALLILVGLLWDKIQAKIPDSVELVGQEQFYLDDSLSELQRTELAWASYSLLNNTVTQSVLLYWDGKTVLRRGILPPGALEVVPGAIVSRILTNHKAVYLVDTSKYPGKVEFGYLPENIQGIIAQPIGEKGVLILGANAPRSYTQLDENWIEAIAQKISYVMEKAL